MTNRKTKWLMYTVLIGLIPVASRILVWIVSKSRPMDLFNSADFMMFGLILHISTINEIEHLSDRQGSWKTIQNGTSIAFIVMYAVLFASHILGQSYPDIIDAKYVLYVTIPLCCISAFLGWSVHDRISRLIET